MYPYVPQNDDELELVTGDFIFMSPVEQSSASEGWVYGTSLGTGLSGLLPENYVNRADESDTWVVHGYGREARYSAQTQAHDHVFLAFKKNSMTHKEPSWEGSPFLQPLHKNIIEFYLKLTIHKSFQSGFFFTNKGMFLS